MSTLDRLFAEALPALAVEPDGRQHIPARPPRAVLAGSFNPLHPGHLGLAATAARLLQTDPVFELCVRNVDKPALTPDEVARRLRQFAWRYPLWLTHAPTFAAKARLFPRAVFVVGVDTAERIVAGRYYDNDVAGMVAALHELRRQACRFLVAGRRDAAGRFTRLADLDIPEAVGDLFDEIPPALFRLDVSSTEIRGRQTRG